MLVDGFREFHRFRASVPDDGEFDGVMGFAVPVLHVSVKECGAALLSLLAQFRQFNVEEMNVGQRPWFAVGSSEMVVPCVRVGSLDRFGEHGDVTRRASDVGEDETRPAFVDINSEFWRHGRLGSRRRCCGEHGVYLLVGYRFGLFVVCVADFTHDIPNAGEQARDADDCQDHSEAIPPICGQPFKNFVHVHQSIRAVGGVSCRI